jgi:hypothetical protein
MVYNRTSPIRLIKERLNRLDTISREWVKEETHFTVISNADIKELTYSLHSFSSIVVEIDGIIQANESHAHCMEVRYIIQNDYYPLRYAFLIK